MKKTESKISKDKEKKITPKMLIFDVISKHPETMEVFQKYGLHCFGCAFARMEKIEDIAVSHGIDIKKLVGELNTTLEK